VLKLRTAARMGGGGIGNAQTVNVPTFFLSFNSVDPRKFRDSRPKQHFASILQFIIV